MRGEACAVIVAGGEGSRFGAEGGKLLVDVAGKPLMTWCLEAFDRSDRVGHIVVVCPEGRTDEMRRRAIEPFGLQTPLTFAVAGATRQDSTRAGVEATPAGLAFTAVHDAARPLITTKTIDVAIDRLSGSPELDGVVCGQPAIDTLKLMDGERIVETPPRSAYWTVQTPQVFRTDVLRRAIRRAAEEGFQGTDDSSLVERAGGAVACIESPRDNLKVTVPEDLPLVEALLRSR